MFCNFLIENAVDVLYYIFLTAGASCRGHAQ